MPYKNVGGRMVRVEVTRTVGHHPEVVTTVELQVYTCPDCGNTYKTEAGLERHTEANH